MKATGRKVEPQNMTSIMFGLCFGGWFFLLDVVYFDLKFNLYPNENHKLILIFIVLITSVLIQKVYSANNRYLKVYADYASRVNIKKTKGVLFSFSFLLFPYLLLFIFFLSK